MRPLRRQLFAALLGAVLLAVGVSLAVGILLTRDATRDAIEDNLAREADQLAARFATLPGAEQGDFLFRAPAPGPEAGVAPGPPLPGAAGVGPGLPPGTLPPALSMEDAASLLPEDAVAALERGEPASGTVAIDDTDQVFEARPVGEAVVLATRPDDSGGDDFRNYLSALLIAGGLAILLAAGLAAFLARRLAEPIGRVAEASRTLAAGKSPEPLPRERTEELSALADAFNEMATQLERAREAERSVLLSVSHDLRTPLTAVQGYAEGIEDGTLEPGAAATVIAREAKRLERLVDDLLALARLRQGILEMRSEPVDLGAVLREAGERLRPQAEGAGVALAVESAGDGAVTADHGRVLQVATNLLENAIRVSPTGGTVEARIGAGEFTVADSGPGIPPEEIERAFERFHLRDRLGRGSAGGAGVGLAIVRELTEAMGGSVAVASPPGEGARFTVSLPR
jgi:two-component system sensor histidine kinase BaeS